MKATLFLDLDVIDGGICDDGGDNNCDHLVYKIQGMISCSLKKVSFRKPFIYLFDATFGEATFIEVICYSSCK